MTTHTEHQRLEPSDASGSADGTRRRRRAARGGAVARRVTLVAGALVAATLLSGCQWALHNGADAPVGRRTCQVQPANMVHVDTTGFNAGQLSDIQGAIGYLRERTGVPLQYVAAPGENWREVETDNVLIEKHRVVDTNGYTRTAYSKPYDRNGDGWYDAGVLWIDPYADGIATWGRWGSGGSNFYKLIVHELSHQLGIADVNDPGELMGNIGVEQPGWGDLMAWNAVGC